MRFTSRLCYAIAIVATTATVASAADVRHRHVAHHRAAPSGFDGAYNSVSNGRGTGTSVPYDADGPGYNDFQLQGR